MAIVIDGKRIAAQIEEKLKQSCENQRTPPCLTVILVGERKDSEVYVRMKEAAAKRIGIVFCLRKCDNSVTQTEMEALILQLNRDPTVHGIILQLPLPPSLDESSLLQLISPIKDVDGFHPQNSVTNAQRLFTSCTPRAVMYLLEHVQCPLKGATVVLVGTGHVGMPLAVLLMEQRATVICCNADTKNIQELASRGDIVIAAAGCAQLVKRGWIKSGAVVIDVGINSGGEGRKLVGDVDYDEVAPIASFITPVPGGVGPMTVAMLMSAVIEAWKRQN